jgi:hypothetical protein
MKMEQCSETSAHKIQTPGNNPEESIQHSEHGECLKSRNIKFLLPFNCSSLVSAVYESHVRTECSQTPFTVSLVCLRNATILFVYRQLERAASLSRLA